MYANRTFPIQLALLVFALLIGGLATPPAATYAQSSPTLTYGSIVKWDSSGGRGHTYSVSIDPTKTTIIAVVVLQGNFTPTLSIDAAAGCSVSSNYSRAAVSFCSEGTVGTYTLAVGTSSGNVNSYAVLAQVTNNGSTESVTGIMGGGANRSLNANRVSLYNIVNDVSSNRQRTMNLSATNSRLNKTSQLSFAVMFREDGTMVCNSWNDKTCEVFDQRLNYVNYHLLMIDADNDAIIFTLELKA